MFNRLFGRDDQEPRIGVNLPSVTMPLGMAIQLVFRQQEQLFQMLNTLDGKIQVHDHLLTSVGEHQTELHDYLLQLQNNLEKATRHAVEREDDLTEVKENKKDERPN
jgi:hypothetical protein